MFTTAHTCFAKLGLPVVVAVLLLLSGSYLNAGESRHDNRSPRNHPDRREQYNRHENPHHNSRGGFSFRVTPTPIVTNTVVVPAPVIISYSNGMIVQRNYSYLYGSLVYEDTVLQTAPGVVLETQVVPVTPQPMRTSQPAWLDILRGFGMNIRW